MRWLVFVTLAACSADPAPQQRAAPSAIATPYPGDVIVAQVNGRPVWGSCVTAQRKAARAALDECIAFELLAQEAERRALATDPIVVDATRTALVDRLVETGFDERYKSPADLATVIDAHIERHKARLERPEARASAYIRFEVPKTDDARAKQLAEQLIAKLKDERGLHPAHLVDTAIAMFGVQAFSTETVAFYAHATMDKPYADALFSIDDVGRIHPQPVRTRWGWDVILLHGVQPAKKYTRDEAANEVFGEVRRNYFNLWVNQIAKSLGVTITIDPKRVAKVLEEASS